MNRNSWHTNQTTINLNFRLLTLYLSRFKLLQQCMQYLNSSLPEIYYLSRVLPVIPVLSFQ